MDNVLFQSYKVEDRSYVAFIKREIHNLVHPVFTELRTGEIDIVVSEAASNLIKHAGSGEILYRLSSEQGEPVFELICLDNGPGMNVSHSIKDGVSSKNTLGQGLGAIVRLSSFAQVYSQPDWGTVIYSKFFNSPDFQPARGNVLLRCINVAKPGEKVSGDGMAVKLFKDKTIILVGDGLGHGHHANDAVNAAIQTFADSSYADPAELIKELNIGVKRTRGLVATVVLMDHKRRQIQVCGIGNIHTRLQTGLEYKNYIGNNGIVGLNIPSRLQNAVYEMEKMHQVILCSDGIKTKWDLVRYPNILKYDPMMLAAVLYKDHARQTDDMTILTVKVI